jgi:hypothetical protein
MNEKGAQAPFLFAANVCLRQTALCSKRLFAANVCLRQTPVCGKPQFPHKKKTASGIPNAVFINTRENP